MARVDAQYVIDIAAQMDGGESTIAELDALTAKLTGAGKNAEHFQAAIKKASVDLATAAAASAAASDALAAGNEKYTELERAAAQASKQVEKLGKSGDLMSREYLEAAQKAHDAATAVNEQAGSLKTLEKNAKAAADNEAKLSQQFQNVKKLSAHADKSIQQQAESLEKLSSGLGAIPGPVGRIGQSLIKPVQGFTKLSGSMGESGASALLMAGGVAAAVVAVVALTAAVAVGAVKVASWAVGLADAARTAGLASEAFNILNPEVSFLAPKIDELAGNTAVAKADLQKMAAALAEAGVSADGLGNALEAAALAESAGGKEASAKYIALEKAAADAQKAVDEAAKKSGGAVAKELTDKLAEAEQAAADFAGRARALRPNVEKQLRGVGKQSEKLEKNFNELFSGLNIEPVLAGFERLVALFDKNSEAGRAMSMIFESVFQPIIDQAENAAVVIEAFILGFLIGLTKLYIQLKPAIRAIGEFFGFDDTSLEGVLDAVASAGEIAAYVFAGFVVVLGALAAAIGLVLGPVVAVTAAVYAMTAGVVAAGAAIVNGFLGAWESVKEFFAKLDFAEIGRQMVLGFVAGITGSSGSIVNAITGAVGGAIAAAKNMLGIHSPSKVFENFGDLTGVGFVEGVEAQNDNAQAAMSEMVEPELPATPFAAVTSSNTGGVPAAPTTQTVAAEGGAGGGGPTVIVHQVTMTGVKDGPSGAQQLGEWLTGVLKGDAAALGNSVEEKKVA